MFYNMCHQEEGEAKQADPGTGEHQCHPSACNRRLQAAQSPNSVLETPGIPVTGTPSMSLAFLLDL